MSDPPAYRITSDGAEPCEFAGWGKPLRVPASSPVIRVDEIHLAMGCPMPEMVRLKPHLLDHRGRRGARYTLTRRSSSTDAVLYLLPGEQVTEEHVRLVAMALRRTRHGRVAVW